MEPRFDQEAQGGLEQTAAPCPRGAVGGTEDCTPRRGRGDRARVKKGEVCTGGFGHETYWGSDPKAE